jgi:hypothetical protein
MVICGSELDAADEQLEPNENAEDDRYGSSTQKCLQVDLRRFGLGKGAFCSRCRWTYSTGS